MNIRPFIMPCLLALAAPAVAQDGFTITCEAPELIENAKVYVYNQETRRDAPDYLLAEGRVTQGRFRLEGRTARPVMATLVLNLDTVVPEGKRMPVASVDLVMDNAEYRAERKTDQKGGIRLTVTSDCTEQQRYEQYVKEMEPFTRPYWEALNAKWDGNMKFTKENIEQADKRIDEAEARMDSAELDYMRQHTGETLAAYLAVKHLKGVYQFTAEEIDGIERSVGTTADTVRTAQLRKALARARKYALGSPYSDFQVVDSAGTARMFSTLIPTDKPMLVDMWASWCGPCRDAIPEVRALHEKYGDKLAILSISVDEKRENWMKALQEEQMPWSQWMAPKPQVTVLAEKYGLQYIPFVFVVYQGKIAAFGHPKTLDRPIARMIEDTSAQ